MPFSTLANNLLKDVELYDILISGAILLFVAFLRFFQDNTKTLQFCVIAVKNLRKGKTKKQGGWRILL